MKSKTRMNTIVFAEGICVITFLPIVGLRMMANPRRQTQSIGRALFVMGSLLWLFIIIARTGMKFG